MAKNFKRKIKWNSNYKITQSFGYIALEEPKIIGDFLSGLIEVDEFKKRINVLLKMI